MRLDEEIQDLERQLQELRRAKVAVAAAFRNDSVIGASSEDASEVTNGAPTPTITVANANCESVTDLPSVMNLHEREKDHGQTDGLNTNDRLDFLENNMTKLKDKINAIQLNVKSIQAIVKENNFILKRRDVSKPFLPNTLRCRLSPAQTSEELDRIAQHPDMLQLLSEINECTLSRTVTQMLKSLMSKELATKYSLTGLSRRREHSKISFKNSPAYQAVEHAVLSSSNYHSLPRKEIFRAITSALKNSSDWDGGRTKRINSKRAEWQAAGQTNAAATATQGDVREHTMEENTESTKDELLEMAVSSATVGLPPGAILGGGEVTLSPVLIPPAHAGFGDMEF